MTAAVTAAPTNTGPHGLTARSKLGASCRVTPAASADRERFCSPATAYLGRRPKSVAWLTAWSWSRKDFVPGSIG